MFKIESYVTPILLSYVDKYVKDFKPADAQVSLWGGGVVLHNLVLKTDILQKEIPLPFTLVSGRIHELLIQVPWTKIMSEPIIVTIDIIECILNPRPSGPNNATPESKSTSKAQVVEAPPGYMQALVRRIVSNISINIHHLILKYVQDDIVLSLNVKRLSVESSSSDWKPAFADIESENPIIRRIVTVDDLTLCLDSADSDGKIRFYQDPLLYRCRIDLRVLTTLVSANTRRANSFHIHILSSKLAFGISNDQLYYLLRLLKEQVPKAQSTPKKDFTSQSTSKLPERVKKSQTEGQAAESIRRESWSEWAWSWMPVLMDREGSTEEAPVAIQPTPVAITVYLDEISLTYKIKEVEASSKKRINNIFEISATYAAMKAYICHPTIIRAKIGIRSLLMQSNCNCPCGHIDLNLLNEKPTIYISNKLNKISMEEDWEWPTETMGEVKIETVVPVHEKIKILKKFVPSFVKPNVDKATEAKIRATISSASAVMLPKSREHDLKSVNQANQMQEGIKLDSLISTSYSTNSSQDSQDLKHTIPDSQGANRDLRGTPPDSQDASQDLQGTNPVSHDANLVSQGANPDPNIESANSDFQGAKPDLLSVNFDSVGAKPDSLGEKSLGANSGSQEANADTNTANPDSEVKVDNEDKFPDDDADFNSESITTDTSFIQEPFWQSMNPVISISFIHERLPPQINTNPYDNPPKDFEHSDWQEECDLNIVLKPLDIRLCVGLFHRMQTIIDVLEMIPETPLPPVKVLTVEESEALSHNLPQRRINVNIKGMCVTVHPWDHSLIERPQDDPMVLDIEIPNLNLIAVMPLYPLRVCSAASQMPNLTGTLKEASKLHITIIMNIQAYIATPDHLERKPFARVSARMVAHSILCSKYFTQKRTILHSYVFQIIEANLSGSSPRLHAVGQIISSLIKQQISLPLCITSLVKDALHDEDLVALDLSIEDLLTRGFLTKIAYTSIVKIQSLRATLFQSQAVGPPKQAWLFSGSDVPTSSPFLRLCLQLGQTEEKVLEYFGFFTEQTAIALDPLLVCWLSYRPIQLSFSSTRLPSRSSVQLLQKPRDTPPGTVASSSGKGQSRSTISEQVHTKPRSYTASSSDRSEKKDNKEPRSSPQETKSKHWMHGDNLLRLHTRLRQMLVVIDTGLILVYITTKTASAVDCATISIAMEKHTYRMKNVIVLSLGRWSLGSNLAPKHLWHYIKQDGPTYKIIVEGPVRIECFPWKMSLADMSCYSLEPPKHQCDKSTGLRSHIKLKDNVLPRTVLELVTTKLVLSVVTKSEQQKTVVKKAALTKISQKSKKDAKTRYFEDTSQFVPTTLQDFLRGPESRKTSKATAPSANPKPPSMPIYMQGPVHKYTDGPIVSVGFNLHADTMPIVLRIEIDQVSIVSATLHCLSHIIALVKANPMTLKQRAKGTSTTGSQAQRLISEMEDDTETIHYNSSHEEINLVKNIYQATPERNDKKISTFCLFQWVISRGTAVITTDDIKLVLSIDDVITSVTLQDTYNQLKVKVSYLSVNYLVRQENDQWEPGVLGGQVIEVREPANAKDDNQFISVTITEARIASLPPSWKEELHPKLLENRVESDTMWEVYVMMAPLEVVVRTEIIDTIIALAAEVIPQKSCLIASEQIEKSLIDFPFCYFQAGGLKILVSLEGNIINYKDDTIMLNVGKFFLNPHPNNPICRRPATANETVWQTTTGTLEGRQYEFVARQISISSAKFSQLVSKQVDADKTIGGENPARKWGENPPALIEEPTIILHPLDVTFLYAPAFYVKHVLACGYAFEFNLTSDCSLELNLNQLNLIMKLVNHIQSNIQLRWTQTLDAEEEKLCPYAVLFKSQFQKFSGNETDMDDEKASKVDSGVDTATIYSTAKSFADTPAKRLSSFLDAGLPASEFVEVFITMGIIELSLYTENDGSPELRPIAQNIKPYTPETHKKNETLSNLTFNSVDIEQKVSLTSLDIKKNYAGLLQPWDNRSIVRTAGINVPLLHIVLSQPNLYYCKFKSQISSQVSLFNLWVGFGVGLQEGQWHADIISTSSGDRDPFTEIPPALITLKYTDSTIKVPAFNVRVGKSLIIDVERPIKLSLSNANLIMLVGIMNLIKYKVASMEVTSETNHAPPLYTLKKSMKRLAIDEININTTQIGINVSNITVGLDQSSFQLTKAARGPQEILARSYISAFLVSLELPDEVRPILHPLHFGWCLFASWDAWRQAEEPSIAMEPSVYVNFDLDRVNIDLTPTCMISLMQSFDTLINNKIMKPIWTERNAFESQGSCNIEPQQQPINPENIDTDINQHFYQDDLRSGAFQIVRGSQMPRAYQITVYKSLITWQYPHPRAITRILMFPLLENTSDLKCVLEFYNKILDQWEAHTYLNVPVSEVVECDLRAQPPDIIFATTWRFRVVSPDELPYTFMFNCGRFLPKENPWESDSERLHIKYSSALEAEQLLSILRIDSYFAPRQTPKLKMTIRLTSLDLSVHNAEPSSFSELSVLEGYYLSKSLTCSHRVLTITTKDTVISGFLRSPSGKLFQVDTMISSRLYDSSTGVMVSLTDNFDLQLAVSVPDNNLSLTHLRMCTSNIRLWMHIQRLRTIQSLVQDWKNAYLNKLKTFVPNPVISKSKHKLVSIAANNLEGRISMWIHNTACVPLRIGQEGAHEAVIVNPGSQLTYRWESPHCAKRIHFALVSTSTELSWSPRSPSAPFNKGNYRIRLENADPPSEEQVTHAEYLYVHVDEVGAHRTMRLSGQLVLANLLRLKLCYKVMARQFNGSTWRTVATGELEEENVGSSVICSTNHDFVLKIRFQGNDNGWSGDIPLKECPKENVPWLVKVPSQEEMPFLSVWCRVMRARSDGRIFASIWPLYVLHSHLTLDIDVMVVSDFETNVSEKSRPAPLIQAAPGRDRTTHILTPGTTSAKHNLSFQYRNIASPVTQQAVPLHYGMTDISVFEKYQPINTIEEALKNVVNWLERSSEYEKSNWPYSLVTKHYSGQWMPALLQPRCEIAVRYLPVTTCAGCSLEIQLSPILILCNAAPINLTVRAHDAAPLCKLETGCVISLPTVVLEKPFFLSIEVGRETFVSGQLKVGNKEPGRYSTPLPGVVTAEHNTTVTIHCINKVAVFKLYYEIINDINVLGITSKYAFINNLGLELLISTISMPKKERHDNIQLEHFKYKVFAAIPPTDSEGTIKPVPLCRFRLHSRWRGEDESELENYVCVSLASNMAPSSKPVPVLLGMPPFRRPIALVDTKGKSTAAVITQHKHQDRWVVTVMTDPCPQFLVNNLTATALKIGQPKKDEEGNPITDPLEIQDECMYLAWHEYIPEGAMKHYSAPDYTFAPRIPHDITPPQTYLTFAAIYDSDNAENKQKSDKVEWCTPVVVMEGEQLIQLAKHVIKMRVHRYPHSSLLELCDVDQNDISASDIRNRLTEFPVFVPNAFSSDDILLEPLSRTAENAKLCLDGSSAGYLSKPAKKLRVKYQENQTENNQLNEEELERSISSCSTEYFVMGKLEQNFRKPSVNFNTSRDEVASTITITQEELSEEYSARYLRSTHVWEERITKDFERMRCSVTNLVLELGQWTEDKPILALHIDRAVAVLATNNKKIRTSMSIANIQVDNLQFENGQYDFAVIATTCAEKPPEPSWPTIWSMFQMDETIMDPKLDTARLLLKTCHEKWNVFSYSFTEMTEVEIRAGPLALYVEDGYVKALAQIFRLLKPPKSHEPNAIINEALAMRVPLRLSYLHIHPIEMTLTLHTAVRMYIALDQSPLRLSAFKAVHLFTTTECLVHSLTVHYLSAALLGAGWVVGGLELLGAPGALAARVGGATGGVRGVAQAAAAAILRSLSAWAGSLARNLDLLAGDEEHARRAAAARRHAPDSFVEGLMQGLSNFAINILGAVGGLAHHPLVGVAVGETESSASALRRSLLGALTKPLSATADLVAYAGHGLLKQTGWDHAPKARNLDALDVSLESGWTRDCVRWIFLMPELGPFAGFEVLLDQAHMILLLCRKCIIVIDPTLEHIVESIDFRLCTMGPYAGSIIEIYVRPTDHPDKHNMIRSEFEITSAAMARVARFTGAEEVSSVSLASSYLGTSRVLTVDTVLGYSNALHAALSTLIHSNSGTHFQLL